MDLGRYRIVALSYDEKVLLYSTLDSDFRGIALKAFVIGLNCGKLVKIARLLQCQMRQEALVHLS